MPEHRAVIGELIDRAGRQLPADRLIRVFEAAFDAIWRRAVVTLGEVTMTAIANRVLHNAMERHPALYGLRLAGEGIDCDALTRRWTGLATQPLAEALEHVLVELLRVIGNLTADILTPMLHDAVASVHEADGGVVPSDQPNKERTP